VTLEGIAFLDKPQGPTSHRVVAMARKALQTRKVGHAGTLDPMATGMLIIGVGRATRLLGFLTASSKSYEATVRLGQTTTTEDADGVLLETTPTSQLTDQQIRNAFSKYLGAIDQRPSSVSAIKVDGVRAHELVRSGVDLQLPPRRVTIETLEVRTIAQAADGLTCDVTIQMRCSAGTYVRALARDVGQDLAVGAHLVALRRTSSGKFSQMTDLDEFLAAPSVMTISEVMAIHFPKLVLQEPQATQARHGVTIAAPIGDLPQQVAVFDAAGVGISVCNVVAGELVPQVVFQ
jgi:tRNA pseudouridine55 synthase